MKYISLTILIFCLGFIFGYIMKKDKKTELKNNPKIIIDQSIGLKLQNKVLIDSLFKTGNVNLYKKLQMEYTREPAIDFLGIAYIMANKYNYTQAYYDVFYTIHSALNPENLYDNSFTFKKYDDKTKKFAKEYLDSAVIRQHINALEMKCQYDKNCNYERLLDSIYK